MEQIRAAMVHRTLHQSVCCQQPASFQQWAQVSRQLSTISAFRANLRSYAPDDVILAQRRAAVVKDGVTIIRTKMELAISSPQTQDRFLIKLLQEDLQLLVSEINSICQAGIVWTAPNFGVTRIELQEWRQHSATLLQSLLDTKKKQDSEELKVTEAYQNNFKVKKMVGINRSTWTDWLTRWRLDIKDIPSEFYRYKMIQNCLSDPDDSKQCKKLKTSDEILTYLYNKYGAF